MGEKPEGAGRPASRALAGLVPGDHACCVFGSDEEQQAIVGRFGRDSLERGSRLLYLADRSDVPRIRRYLDAAGVDSRHHLASHQLEIRAWDSLFSGEDFDPEQHIAALEAEKGRALGDGFRALAAIGEMSWAMAWPGVEERVVSYEHSVGRIFEAADIGGICQYDRRLFPSALLARLTRAHLASVSTTTTQTRVSYGSIVVAEQQDPALFLISGEVDLSVSAYLTIRLREYVGEHAPADVVVNAGGITFIDLAGCRVFARAAADLATERRLILTDAPRCLVRILAVCGWLDQPGLVVRAANGSRGGR